jgi:hypothetical protein
LIVGRPAAKSIVSPDPAVRIACRKVQVAPGQIPTPSALLFTVNVVACAANGAKAKIPTRTAHHRSNLVIWTILGE